MVTAGLLMSNFLNGWWTVLAFLLTGGIVAVPSLKFIVGHDEALKGIRLFKSVLSFKAR